MNDLVAVEKILVVDDDREVNNLLKAMLARLGYVVFQAFSKDKAFSFLISAWPTIIFVDKNLKGSTDYEGVKLLQMISTFPRAKVITKILMGGDINLCEGSFETLQYYRDEWSLELDGLLEKPFGFEQIKTMLQFHMFLNLSPDPDKGS